MQIQVMKRFSVEIVRSNPDCIFVFGDNLARNGCGGQAVIRHEPNAFGIPTKRLSSMRQDAFFADRPGEEDAMLEALRYLYKLSRTHTIVFPEDGLGTGLAKMAEKSPMLFEKLSTILKNYFGFDNNKNKGDQNEPSI